MEILIFGQVFRLKIISPNYSYLRLHQLCMIFFNFCQPRNLRNYLLSFFKVRIFGRNRNLPDQAGHANYCMHSHLSLVRIVNSARNITVGQSNLRFENTVNESEEIHARIISFQEISLIQHCNFRYQFFR